MSADDNCGDFIESNMIGKPCYLYKLREKQKLLVQGYCFSLSDDDGRFICECNLCIGCCTIETCGEISKIKSWTAHEHPPHEYIGFQGQLFLSKRNFNKLEVAGFVFDHERDDKYWSCSRRRIENCKGRCTTVQMGSYKYVSSWTEHSHCPDATELPVQQLKNSLKRRARETNELPSVIVKSIVTQIEPALASHIPSEKTCNQLVKRAKAVDRPVEPTDLEELQIPPGEPLLCDIKADDGSRVVLFGKIAHVAALSESSVFFMDGTFKVVTKLFYQLYTIHGFIDSNNPRKTVPLVYAVLTNKKQSTYDLLFQKLVEIAHQHRFKMAPIYIMTDFEIAAINSSKSVFIESKNKGCLFHFGQSLWRHIQSYGLAIRYGKDVVFRNLMHSFQALAFLPEDEIPAAFEKLKLVLPAECHEFVRYFDKTYVNGTIKTTATATTRIKPLFPPSLWSVEELVAKGLPRTQNSAEAFHRRLNVLIGRSHVGLFVLLPEISAEMVVVDQKLARHNAGIELEKPTKKQALREANIVRLFQRRAVIPSVVSFLTGMASNLSFDVQVSLKKDI
jgi:transcriptional regulator NrdR family protein